MPKTQSLLNNWQKMKLAEIAQDIRQSYSPTRTEKKPYVGLEHIEQQTLQLSEVGRSDETQSAKKIFKAGDILFGTLRPYFRKVTRPKFDGVCSTDIAVIRPTQKGDGNFLKYFIANQDFIDYASNISGGTRMPRANWKTLKERVWQLPELNEQRIIGDVLSTYDNLIENNTKRIKILEEIAQAIYKEWFVYFRFPRLRRGFGGQAGHEKAKSRSERSSATGIKMVDSKTEFSKIPEGWGVGKLSDLATITMGQSPSSDFYNEIGDGSPFHQGVTNFGFRFPVTNTFSTEGTRKAVAGDILFSVRAPVGRINVADRNMIIGRGLAALKSASGYQSFLLYNLKHLFQTEDLIGGGAIFASVTKDDLSNFPVIIPDIKMIEKFESIVRSIDQMILSISNELSVLRNSRDSLLPKLVGGEVGVKNL
ncbi:MAG: Restriction modification system DNA specificity domain protein [Parcubacteria group bacterium GW2011_GWB1_44_7]|nr:MAG: Restriction modification system DNA specificity domain protein [Parcubacteria group bacterium GW2011_GWB1_44_7]